MNNIQRSTIAFEHWKWMGTHAQPYPPIPSEPFMSCFSEQDLMTVIQRISRAARASVQDEIARRNSFSANYGIIDDPTRFIRPIVGSDERFQQIITEFYNNLPLVPVQETLRLYYPYPNRLLFCSITVCSGQEEAQRARALRNWDAWAENPEKAFTMALPPTTTVYAGNRLHNQYITSFKYQTFSHTHWSPGRFIPQKHILTTTIDCQSPYQPGNAQVSLSKMAQQYADLWEQYKSSLQTHLQDFVSCLDPEIQNISAIQNSVEALSLILLQQEPSVAFRIIPAELFMALWIMYPMLPGVLQLIEESLQNPDFRAAIRKGSASAIPLFQNSTVQESFKNCVQAMLKALTNQSIVKAAIICIQDATLLDPKAQLLLQPLLTSLIPLCEQCKQFIMDDSDVQTLFSTDPTVINQLNQFLEQTMGALQSPHPAQIEALCRTAAAQRARETIQNLSLIQRKLIPVIEIVKKKPKHVITGVLFGLTIFSLSIVNLVLYNE